MQINKRKLKILIGVVVVQVLALATIATVDNSPETTYDETIPLMEVSRRSYPIEIRTVGELEAAKSTSISTTIRSDQPKIIDLVADGTNVNEGDLLVKIDSTPYEVKVEEIKYKIQDAQNQISTLQQAYEWEIEQAEHDLKAAAFEMESAELEYNKIVFGDGPLEKAKLRAAMQKAKTKYDELNAFSEDLLKLQEEGFLDQAEVRQTQKKLEEERDTYETAKMQHDSYVEHVFPMLVKKAETTLRKQRAKGEETIKSGKYKISKAEAALTQAKQTHSDLNRQLRDALWELSLTEIRAPSHGMVVLREEFRQSQRRKPRVGDTVIRNQPILDLPDLSSMVVKTKVREIDLYKVDIGKLATIEVDAYPNIHFEGKVSFIGILAVADPTRNADEKYFEVKVVIENSDPRLRPGMTARVIIHAGKVDNALSVPIHSVFEFDKKHYCFVASRGRYTKQPVEIGMNNEQWVEVKSGLQEYDRVCLALPPESSIVCSKDCDSHSFFHSKL